MATARSTTNSDIHSQLNGYVTDYLTKHMYDANTSWPLRKTIRLPKQAELEAHYTHNNTTAKPAKKPKSSPTESSDKPANSSTR